MNRKYTQLLLAFLFVSVVTALFASFSVEPITVDGLFDKSVSGNFSVNEVEAEIGSAQQKIPGWLSIIPPLVAIILALIFKEVISSLLLGVLSGAIILGFYSDGLKGILFAPFQVFSQYILQALNDADHLAVIVFSMTIGGLVAVISKNGGMLGLVNKIAKYATNAQKGQYATWFLGVLIFFDDYANTLVVGNTMRPLTDKLKISREKLAYLVDSTAAPIASVAFVTTWIGAELGYIKDGIAAINESGANLQISPYSVFINSLPFAFYPIFTLIFMLLLIKYGKDFGPMLTAEKRARSGESLNHDLVDLSESEEHFEVPNEGVIPKARYALIPILVLISVTLIGLFYTGSNPEVWASENSFIQKLSETMGNADPYKALLWSSFTGLIVAIVMSVSSKKLSLEKSINTSIRGYKSMFTASIILVLAWSLAILTDQLETAQFLTSILGESVSPGFLPVITFIFAAFVAFSTGSSWGTMAILYPLVLPLAWHIGLVNSWAEPEVLSILFNVTACVLTGSVLGDHCSPISDTTILSSLASSCNHIEHVRTQMPYALTVGAVAIFIGIIPAGFGIQWFISFPLGILILWVIVKKVAKPV